jgi:uncharacterized protein (DUF697 family)
MNLARTDDPNACTAEQSASADALIRKYSLYAMGCGLIPAPVIDMLAVTALEVRMIQELSHAYQFQFPGKLVLYKNVLSLLGSIAPIYFSNKLKNGVKAIPGIGSIAASGLLVLVNGASVYAVGKVFQRHFESGGTFLSSDNLLIRRFFKESYAEGKQVLLADANGRAGAKRLEYC